MIWDAVGYMGRGYGSPESPTSHVIAGIGKATLPRVHRLLIMLLGGYGGGHKISEKNEAK
jgi:hypothetical protein